MSTENNETSIVERLSPKLDGKQRRHLRALGHELKPIIMVGQNGVTANLIDNLKIALTDHELVKVKVHERDAMDETAEALHAATGAQLAQKIGKMLLFYKRNRDDQKIRLPKSSSK